MCRNCRKRRHLSNDCKNDNVCARCGSTGHYATKDCPSAPVSAAAEGSDGVDLSSLSVKNSNKGIGALRGRGVRLSWVDNSCKVILKVSCGTRRSRFAGE